MILGQHQIRIALACAIALIAIFELRPVQGAQPDEKVNRAIASGLSFLARQQADDGSFADGAPRPSTTAIALLSFLSSGHVQDVGRHGLTVRRAVEYLVKVKAEDAPDSEQRSMLLTALVEAYTVEPDAKSRLGMLAVISNLADSLLHDPEDADLSRWRWRMLALRAARSIGVEIPRAEFDRLMQRGWPCFHAESSGFSDLPEGAPTASATAPAMVVFSLLDSPQREKMPAAAKFLSAGMGDLSEKWNYRRLLDLTQATSLSDAPLRQSMWDAATTILLPQQTSDGAWPAGREGDSPGRVYSTSMAILTLSIPMRVLPTFQP